MSRRTRTRCRPSDSNRARPRVEGQRASRTRYSKERFTLKARTPLRVCVRGAKARCGRTRTRAAHLLIQSLRWPSCSTTNCPKYPLLPTIVSRHVLFVLLEQHEARKARMKVREPHESAATAVRASSIRSTGTRKRTAKRHHDDARFIHRIGRAVETVITVGFALVRRGSTVLRGRRRQPQRPPAGTNAGYVRGVQRLSLCRLARVGRNPGDGQVDDRLEHRFSRTVGHGLSNQHPPRVPTYR